MAERRPALGKGLSALIPDAPESRQGPAEIDIDLLLPSDQQPRRSMDDARLNELSDSIRTHGIIQPILVRRVGKTYRIIAGERRWRAAQRAGLHKVPVIVRETEGSEKERLEIAMIENVQREDLGPLDEAKAYGRLADEFRLTQEQIAAAVGKDRSSVANSIRLLKLGEEVRQHLADGRLSVGHARALLAVTEADAQKRAAADVIARGLSVRETEALVKRLGAPGRIHKSDAIVANDVHTKAAEEAMRFALGAKVLIRRRGAGGAIEISFDSEDELNRLFDYIAKNR